MAAAIRSGACNACHQVVQRLCRWLLTCSDVLEAPEIGLSQDVFAKMLGVQRTSINPILQELKADGALELGRSRIVITDRVQLLGYACECYAAMRRDQQAVMGPVLAAGALSDKVVIGNPTTDGREKQRSV
jgi:hypothetical protein